MGTVLTIFRIPIEMFPALTEFYIVVQKATQDSWKTGLLFEKQHYKELTDLCKHIQENYK